tara:strand:+ start:1144 stop:1338 length:195 start_codon:yes stop_codon:yes gene_type:complete
MRSVANMSMNKIQKLVHIATLFLVCIFVVEIQSVIDQANVIIHISDCTIIQAVVYIAHVDVSTT